MNKSWFDIIHSRIFREADRAKKERERKAAVLWRYFFLPGIIELPILVGSNNAICMVDLGDLPVLVRCLGW